MKPDEVGLRSTKMFCVFLCLSLKSNCQDFSRHSALKLHSCHMGEKYDWVQFSLLLLNTAGKSAQVKLLEIVITALRTKRAGGQMCTRRRKHANS